MLSCNRYIKSFHSTNRTEKKSDKIYYFPELILLTHNNLSNRIYTLSFYIFKNYSTESSLHSITIERQLIRFFLFSQRTRKRLIEICIIHENNSFRSLSVYLHQFGTHELKPSQIVEIVILDITIHFKSCQNNEKTWILINHTENSSGGAIMR
jgi:hypothetical protein